MPRGASSPKARLAKLHKSLIRAQRECEPGTVLSQQPMYNLLGVTRHTLTEWVNEIEGFEESGCFSRGGNGIGYEFNPIATIWFLIRHFEQVEAGEVAKLQEQRKMIAGDKLDSVPEGFTIKESKEALELHLSIISAERDAGKLIDAEKSSAMFNDLIVRMREECLSAPQKLDPTNDWDPEVRASFDKMLADFMLLLQDAGKDFVKGSMTNGSVSAGTNGAGAGSAERAAAH